MYAGELTVLHCWHRAGELTSDDPNVPWADEIEQKLLLPPSIGARLLLPLLLMLPPCEGYGWGPALTA